MHPISQSAGLRKLLQYNIDQYIKALDSFESGLRVLGFDPADNPHAQAMHRVIATMHNQMAAMVVKNVMVNADMYSDSRGFHP